MSNAKAYSNAFKVYEIDDLITNIPIKNYFKSAHPKDTVKLMREGIAQVDRLIVSTQGLAEAYAGWHSDIQVLELKLPPVWWSSLKITRTEHKKPRVGWAGGSSHLGDLELIADVVKDLAGEVDWIFFGMCPKKLRPYIKEFHNGVPIHIYPQKLATLDLDLAVFLEGLVQFTVTHITTRHIHSHGYHFTNLVQEKGLTYNTYGDPLYTKRIHVCCIYSQ
jgi:hypothetical protein